MPKPIFEQTVEGCEAATEYLKQIKKLDWFNQVGFGGSTDGYSLVAYANWNKYVEENFNHHVF